MIKIRFPERSEITGDQPSAGTSHVPSPRITDCRIRPSAGGFFPLWVPA